jgi:hydroxylaminobenzene mutase
VSPPLLTSLGLISLALAGLSGWLVLAITEKPEWFLSRGISAPRRFLQLHLDWVMMGLLLIAVDQAVPVRPEWITAALAFGTMVNPLLFVPVAWGPAAKEKPLYKGVVVISFLSLSIGLPALAINALL